MKRTLILATIFLLCGVASAQQPKQAHADAIKMPAEYAVKIGEVVKASSQYAEANAKLVAAWKDYVAQQTAFQNEITRLITRAALAARLTVEQLDNSDLKADDKGNYEWVPKSKPETVKADKPKQ